MSVMAGDDGNCFWRDRGGEGGDLMHVERSPPQYTAKQVKRFFPVHLERYVIGIWYHITGK